MLDRVADLKFLANPPNLSALYFTDLKDGDMEPILQRFRSPWQVDFYPYERPHYQYSKKQLHALLEAKTKRQTE